MAAPDATKELLAIVDQRDPNQPEFRQAVEEVVETLAPVFARDAKYVAVMKRILEPERAIQFRVPWIDDQGIEQVCLREGVCCED
jgi:glutamate dehydrogenase (NADP+)